MVTVLKLCYIETEKAVGKVICHDITQIKKGTFKGPRFKKGHIIREEDVDILLDIGKKHIYLMELEEGDVHEDEAGMRMATVLKGGGLTLNGPSEGKVDFIASNKGLLKVNVEILEQINSLDDVIVSTLHNNSPVSEGEKVAGTRAIPLIVNEQIVKEVENLGDRGYPLLEVKPYKSLNVGGVITGREVKEGRTRDAFAPVLKEKVATFDFKSLDIVFVGDEIEEISGAIEDHLQKGCQLIIVTGGMSVDPDDVTAASIKKTGATVIKYGAPVLPGAMFLLAYKGTVPIIGLPACAMYYQNTVLDIILPRIAAGEEVTARDIIRLGHGGLCRVCSECVFPNCSFGKGGC